MKNKNLPIVGIISIILIILINPFSKGQNSTIPSINIFNFDKSVVSLVIAFLLVFFIVYCVTTVVIDKGAYLKGLKTKGQKEKLLEVFNLVKYRDYFPSEISDTIDSYFADEASNVALAVYLKDDQKTEFYWAVSNSKIDKKFINDYFTINGLAGKPIYLCKDNYPKAEFIIRGSEGQLIPLIDDDIRLIKNRRSYSAAYYTCSERKIIGEFLSKHGSELNESSNTLIIFTKRPPCKYCNDMIDYYNNKYGDNLSLFVFDYLLINLINSDKEARVSFDNIEDINNIFNAFEQKREEKNKDKIIRQQKDQAIINNANDVAKTIERYKNIIKTLVDKLSSSKNDPPKYEDIKKITCISEKHKYGLTEDEFKENWKS